ncbi:MAG: prepilin peptidase [Thiomargarita sp.]|nr:prepilin peptidase [Thiomargarita sp.]
MNLLNYLATEPKMMLFIAGFLGLIVGSFLNVVIYRLPIMMEREWRKQCAELLNVSVQTPSETLNLNQPRSHCPHCGHQIKVLENIPILSYIWQWGKCTACHHKISPRYPIIEATSAILAMITTWHFGLEWSLIGALVLTWALLAASMIDFDHQLLPDNITLPLLWLGILCNLFGLYTDIESSIIGAMAGYLILWTLYWLFKIVTGKEGMGYGDFKLLAMLGAWMGWQALPLIILMSSIVGAIVGITLVLMRLQDKSVPIPFGPYLAAAGWINLLWGSALTHAYLLWTYH